VTIVWRYYAVIKIYLVGSGGSRPSLLEGHSIFSPLDRRGAAPSLPQSARGQPQPKLRGTGKRRRGTLFFPSSPLFSSPLSLPFSHLLCKNDCLSSSHTTLWCTSRLRSRSSAFHNVYNSSQYSHFSSLSLYHHLYADDIHNFFSPFIPPTIRQASLTSRMLSHRLLPGWLLIY